MITAVVLAGCVAGVVLSELSAARAGAGAGTGAHGVKFHCGWIGGPMGCGGPMGAPGRMEGVGKVS